VQPSAFGTHAVEDAGVFAGGHEVGQTPAVHPHVPPLLFETFMDLQLESEQLRSALAFWPSTFKFMFSQSFSP